jgi:LysM repeat protein
MSQNGLTDMALQADKDIKVKIKALHQVAGGEGLKAISEKYNVPTKSILIANGLTSDILPADIQLIIPLK